MYHNVTQFEIFMLIVSSREFRQNQKIYFDKIDNNEQIIIQRGKNKSYQLVPIKENDRIISDEEFIEKLNLSINQINEGKINLLTQEKQKELFEL